MWSTSVARAPHISPVSALTCWHTPPSRRSTYARRTAQSAGSRSRRPDGRSCHPLILFQLSCCLKQNDPRRVSVGGLRVSSGSVSDVSWTTGRLSSDDHPYPWAGGREPYPIQAAPPLPQRPRHGAFRLSEEDPWVHPCGLGPYVTVKPTAPERPGAWPGSPGCASPDTSCRTPVRGTPGDDNRDGHRAALACPAGSWISPPSGSGQRCRCCCGTPCQRCSGPQCGGCAPAVHDGHAPR